MTIAQPLPNGPGLFSIRTLNGRNLVAVVAAGSLISAIGLGVRSTFGVYLDPVVESLGTDRGTYSLAIAIQNLLWGLSQPVSGALADRYGSSRVLAVGGIGYALALFALSTVESTGLFYLTAGFAIGIATGAASFSLVLAAVGRMVPPERAPMALGIVTAMASVGQFLLVPLTQWLVSNFDWRAAMVVAAGIVGVVALIAPMLRGTALDQQGRGIGTEDPGADRDQGNEAPVPLRAELRRAANSRAFLLLNAAFFVCGFHVTFIGTHLVSYSGDVGVGAAAATAGLAVIGLFNIVGSLGAGYLGSRRSKTKLLAGIYGMRAVVILIFLLLPTTGTSVVVFGAAIGVLWLSTVPLTGGIVNGLFGTTHAGTLFGIVFLGHQLGAFVGAWLGGELADRSGTYVPVWWIAIGLGVFAAVIHLMIDESPAPPAPEGRRSPVGLAPAGAAAVALVAGVGALFHPGTAGADRAQESARAPLFCVLHPVDIPD